MNVTVNFSKESNEYTVKVEESTTPFRAELGESIVVGGGEGGENGATFTPTVSEDGVISWSNDKGLPNPDPVDITGPVGPAGKDGADGAPGKDGVDGENGKNGERGTGILRVTTAPQGYVFAVGGKFPKKRMALSTICNEAGVNKVLVGDTIAYESEHCHVYYIDSTYAYMDSVVSVRGADGADGKDGVDGQNGVDGKNGADGADGKDGTNGIDGERGTGTLKVTTEPSSYIGTVGSYSMRYRMAISTIKSQSGVSKVLVGDIIQYTHYQYHVRYVDSTYAYISDVRVSIRGAAGADGTNGKDGVDGKDGAPGKDGATVQWHFPSTFPSNVMDYKDGDIIVDVWNGYVYIANHSTGQFEFTMLILRGQQGDKGDKGDPYTLTQDDRNMLVNDVLAALPNAEGVGF